MRNVPEDVACRSSLAVNKHIFRKEGRMCRLIGSIKWSWCLKEEQIVEDEVFWTTICRREGPFHYAELTKQLQLTLPPT
jgi:hypothetical protein